MQVGSKQRLRRTLLHALAAGPVDGWPTGPGNPRGTVCTAATGACVVQDKVVHAASSMQDCHGPSTHIIAMYSHLTLPASAPHMAILGSKASPATAASASA